MAAIIVNFIGILLIAGIIWWFWIASSRTRAVQGNQIDIVVENGVYTPAAIVASADKPVLLNFTRKDATPCAEKVVFSSLDITRDLPLNEQISIELHPAKGRYRFTCQMQMYQGTLEVR